MKKSKLTQQVKARKSETKEALDLVISCITAKGQRKKITENKKAKELLDFYKVDVNE